MTRYFIFLFCFCISIYSAQDLESPLPFVQNDNLENEIQLEWICPDKPFQTEKFLKTELGIKLPEKWNQEIVAFFNGEIKKEKRLNPFNPEDIRVDLDLFNSDGALVDSRPGFYYEAYKKDLEKNVWIKDTTSFSFRIRFSPNQTGRLNGEIKVKIREQTLYTKAFSCLVADNNNPGFLEIGTNGKHMRFSDSKKSFVGVGQDIPWPVWEDWSRLDKAIGPQPLEAIYRSLDAFKVAGGNYTRFVASSWFMQLEFEALGNYQPRMGQAWEFDNIADFCDKNGIYYMFCALLHTPLESRSEEKAGLIPGVRWETNCYNDLDQSPAEIPHEEPIGIRKAIEFYSNPIANQYTRNYFRYLVARYGYSTNLAGWQLMSEVDETAEYRDQQIGDSIIDRSENRLHVRNWTNAMSTYIREDLKDPHLISIAIIKGKGFSKTLWDPELYNLKNIDFFGYHDYMYENETGAGKTRNRNLLLRYSSVNELNLGFQNGSISYPDFQKKLFIYDEFGHFLSIPRKLPEDQFDDPTVAYNNCADFMFKQDLWFTFASGCAVAGLDWWNNDQLERYKVWEKYFSGIKSFVNDIDFENTNYNVVRETKGNLSIAQRWPLTEEDINRSNAKPYRKNDLLEAYTQVSEDGSQAFGWMSNRSVHPYNLLETYPCLSALYNGTEPFSIPYLYPPKDDDFAEAPINIDENEYFIKIYHLRKNEKYEINFYNTISGEIIETETSKTNSMGTLKLMSPNMNLIDNPDVAYKISLVK
jgi:hypothetical protein